MSTSIIYHLIGNQISAVFVVPLERPELAKKKKSLVVGADTLTFSIYLKQTKTREFLRGKSRLNSLKHEKSRLMLLSYIVVNDIVKVNNEEKVVNRSILVV